MMSYGLPLLGILGLAILFISRRIAPAPWAIASTLAVVIAFFAAGFAWWEAFPALHERQFAGVASNRPQQYYLWANLAALAWSAGPAMYAGAASAVSRPVTWWRGLLNARRPWEPDRTVTVLVVSAAVMVLAADVSGSSRGEVERIWLPFVPWLLLGTALLPRRWCQVALIFQVAVALCVQHLLRTGW
jgi:hypothetical protein